MNGEFIETNLPRLLARTSLQTAVVLCVIYENSSSLRAFSMSKTLHPNQQLIKGKLLL